MQRNIAQYNNKTQYNIKHCIALHYTLQWWDQRCITPSMSELSVHLNMYDCTFTCVGWQVTLRDPIWQMTSRSSEVGLPRKSYWPLPFAFTCRLNRESWWAAVWTAGWSKQLVQRQKKHICVTRPWRFVTFYISALEILLLTYLLYLQNDWLLWVDWCRGS